MSLYQIYYGQNICLNLHTGGNEKIVIIILPMALVSFNNVEYHVGSSVLYFNGNWIFYALIFGHYLLYVEQK